MLEDYCDSMIFVTVGMGVSEEIVKKMDEISPRLNEEVLILLGETDYIPKNCKFMKSIPSIIPFVKRANIVITHGGAGTLFECLHNNARIIAVAKKHADDHQRDIIEKLSDDGYIIRCDNINDLENLINDNRKLKKYVMPKSNISKIIKDFLEKD